MLASIAKAMDSNGTCVSVAGECCPARPNFSAAAFLPFGSQVSVGTASPELPGSSVVAVFDLGNPGAGPNAGPFNTNWPGSIYTDPTWSETNLGSVFGVTLDDQGNIFVASTSCYNVDFLGSGGSGAIYKINGVTSVAAVFATLPNSGQELGNICFDCDHHQFFVSNMDDGRIYRLSPGGATLSTYDFGAPDNPLNDFAPLGERIWAVQKHNGRVYFSVWREDAGTPSVTDANEIWSIALDGTGEFFGTARLELTLPVYQGGYSNPVADMRFSQTGSMFVAERGMMDETTSTPHQARLLEFVCVGGHWTLSPNTFPVGVATGDNCSGGVDVSPGSCGRVFVTGDALQVSPQVIYGTQGLPLSGGNFNNSVLIDFNGNLTMYDKPFIGDVAVPCKVFPDDCAPPTPGYPSCSGDSGCPCGNNSPVGSQTGCLNSTGNGAKLTGTGVPYSQCASCPSVAPPGLDTVTLTVTGVPNGPGLVFRGNTIVNGGLGNIFGDGLACCGGQITRSGVQMGSGNTMTFGYPFTKLSVDTESCAGVTYCYQAWFRDSAAFCTSALFNTSNSYQITWLP